VSRFHVFAFISFSSLRHEEWWGQQKKKKINETLNKTQLRGVTFFLKFDESNIDSPEEKKTRARAIAHD
jgi:hypothetical protein